MSDNTAGAMTDAEFRSETTKAFTAELGRATVAVLRQSADIPCMATIDGRTALLIVADSLEQSIEEKTL